jgi:hypothetical protein
MPKIIVNALLTLGGVMQARDSGNNAGLIQGDVVAARRRLRLRPGQALQTLQQNDLIDEYRLFVHPPVLGCGKPQYGQMGP